MTSTTKTTNNNHILILTANISGPTQSNLGVYQ